MPADTRALPYLVLVGVQVAFASLPIASKLLFIAHPEGQFRGQHLSPVVLVWFRCVFTLLAFAWIPFVFRSGFRANRLNAKELWTVLWTSFLGIFLNQVFFLHGVRWTSANHTTLLVATIPLFTFVLAVLLKRETFHLRHALGVGLACVGVASMNMGGGDIASFWGDFLIVCNSICFSLYLVNIKGVIMKHGSWVPLFWSFVFVSIFSSLYLGLGHPELHHEIGWAFSDPKQGLNILYIVLVVTVFTYGGNAFALSKVKSSVVSGFIYLQPPMCAFFAYVFLKEKLQWQWLVAFFCIAWGIRIITKPTTRLQ